MVLVASKSETNTASTPLNIVSKKDGDTPSLSFSQLLHGARTQKDEKVVQNGALLLSLEETQADTASVKSTKTDTLMSLLKGEEISLKKEDETPVALNPKLTATLTPAELKTLVIEAKQYLKDKILKSEGFTKAEIEALPKTLKGLVSVAKKLGIDVSKITLEEVKAEAKPSVKPTLKEEVPSKVAKDKDAESEQIKKSSAPSESIATTKVATKSSKVVETNKQKLQDDTQFQEQVKSDTNAKELPKEVKATPLFKAQVSKEITTQQLVNAKATTIELKTPKEKADDTLKLLLRGEKVSKTDLGMTADFSVATARVIAPTATTEVGKNLESLLRGDQQQESPTNTSKLDGLTTAKSDSFEVKLSEAKQMIKYLSQDVKTAIEDYKSPFTRIKVQLNPQKLGEVDLTIVQRGKNLHVSLSSNNAAINTLSMNANDLKQQLSNSGINNATLNFNNNSQSQDGSASQQQQSGQNREQAHKEYNYFDGEEMNEEIQSSLEIVVPHYA